MSIFAGQAFAQNLPCARGCTGYLTFVPHLILYQPMYTQLGNDSFRLWSNTECLLKNRESLPFLIPKFFPPTEPSGSECLIFLHSRFTERPEGLESADSDSSWWVITRLTAA